MKPMLSEFFRYLFRVLSHWFTILSFIPGVYALLQTYIFPEWTAFHLPPLIAGIVAIIGLFLATFVEWHSASARLQAYELAIPRYEIRPWGWAVPYEIDRYIATATEKLQHADRWLSEHPSDPIRERFTVVTVGPTRLDYQQYISDLNDYIDDLAKLRESLSGTVHLRFTFENVGRLYDENLRIEITPSSNLTFFSLNLKRFLPSPRRPTGNLHPPWLDIPTPELGPQYRNIEKLGKEHLIVEIADLRAGESIDLLEQPLYTKGTGEHILDAKISSKNLGEPVHKRIIFDLDSFTQTEPPGDMKFG